MDLEVKNEQPEFYKHVVDGLNNNYLSHAYLIESNNNTIDVVKSYILFFVKKIYEHYYDEEKNNISKEKLLHLVEKNEFPDYMEIMPIGNLIKKEQLLEVKERFLNKSVFGTKQIYVVYDADKMNSSSANTILKFLEEPGDGIVAFFVVNNRYNVIDTILSRCQVISLKNVVKEISNLDDNLEEFLSNILKRREQDLLLSYDKYLSNLFKDKELASATIRSLLSYYRNLLNDFNYDNYSLEELVSIISIFEESLKKLKYNVNMKLWLDNMLFLLMEV